MDTTQMAFRVVPYRDKFVISVYVESENRYFEAEATAGEVATIRDIFDSVLPKATE